MTDQEWLAYLDRLAALGQPTGAEIAETLGALMERLNTVIIGYANRGNGDVQQLAKQLEAVRSAMNDLRTVIQDNRSRLSELEQPSTKAVNDASNQA